MAIVKMSKFHLFILSKDNNELLKALQRQNLVNFNDLEIKEEDQDFLKKVPICLLYTSDAADEAGMV